MENYFTPSILHQAEKNLVQLLLGESDKVIAKINVDIELILKDNHQVDFRKEYENLKINLNREEQRNGRN